MKRILVSELTYEGLENLVKLHKGYGAVCQQDSVQALAGYILGAIVDGSQRSGSWEGELLSKLGLEPNDY